MATSRNKQDEKNLKSLRDLAALNQNKWCFDCHQRGPTYVNVTIGSFVCTKCSGLLRGLTPPHRLKSISMATFTTEEIELLQHRGNAFCRHVWLGLFDETDGGGKLKTLIDSGRDDDQIARRDHLIDKYEKKRYYVDPAQAQQMLTTNNNEQTKLIHPPPNDNNQNNNNNNNRELKNNTINTTNNNRKRPEKSQNTTTPTISTTTNFAVNFEQADIFDSNLSENFANFDENPVFDSTKMAVTPAPLISTTNKSTNEFSIFDLQFDNYGPILNQVPLFPKCNHNYYKNYNNNYNNNLMSMSPTIQPSPFADNFKNIPKQQIDSSPVASEDRYAALKDLDNALKSKNNNINTINNMPSSSSSDWNNSSTNGSNGSLYSSSTPNGSMYSLHSPQNSMFGSPTQGHFMNNFTQENSSNPFNNLNNTNNNGNSIQNGRSNINWNQNGGGSGGVGHVIQQNLTVASPPLMTLNPFRNGVDQYNKINNGFTNNNNNFWSSGANPFKDNLSTNLNPFL